MWTLALIFAVGLISPLEVVVDAGRDPSLCIDMGHQIRDQLDIGVECRGPDGEVIVLGEGEEL